LLVVRKNAARNEGKAARMPRIDINLDTHPGPRNGACGRCFVSTRTPSKSAARLDPIALVFLRRQELELCAAAGLMLSTVPFHSRPG